MFFKRRKKAVEEPDRKAISAEEEAERRKEDVRWFKRIMSHNIRMPLAVIVGYGELLTNGGFKAPFGDVNNKDVVISILNVLLPEHRQIAYIDVHS